MNLAKDLQAQQNSRMICSKPFQTVIVDSAFKKSRRRTWDRSSKGNCVFFSGLSFFFSFSFKICEIKEQTGQGGNACNMRQSMGQEERVEKGSG